MFKLIHEEIKESVLCQLALLYVPAILVTISPWYSTSPYWEVIALGVGISTMVVLAFIYIRESYTFRKWEQFKKENP